MEEKEALQRIKELETELVKLRLQTRHIDFSKDYDRRQYLSKGYLSGKQVEPIIINFLQKQEKPIKYDELIKTLVQQIPNLSEADFEKTGSGNIRIYSMIRSTIEKLTRKKIITKSEHGKLILAEKWKELLELQELEILAKEISEEQNKLMDKLL